MLISKTIGIGKTDKEDKALVEDKIDSEALLENFTDPKIETEENALLFGLREDICPEVGDFVLPAKSGLHLCNLDKSKPNFGKVSKKRGSQKLI
jgi:hypothetical protein